MPREKYQQKLLKHRLCTIARFTTCASFLILTIIAISSFVRAMTLEPIQHENGIPTSWNVASLGNPSTITVPISYWDQRQDPCGAANRQFEWTQCRITATSAQQGIVQKRLGSDGLPVPTYTTTTEARAAGVHQTSENVTGHNPVVAGDNFYSWFHETDRSKRFNREVTFTRTSNNTYSYGGSDIFPLDNVNFSDGDEAWRSGHNFHFTAHMRIAMKIAADGTERFDFSGDDDVWVFLNDQLVLDIGGLHAKLDGHFIINQDGTLSTYVETAGSKTVDIGLKAGDVVNLDFFYAERSTNESNTRITIANMNWPISADSNISSTIVGKVGDTESNLVQNITSIKNRDPENNLSVDRIAAFVREDTHEIHNDETNEDHHIEGYVPLSIRNLYYSTTPNDPASWRELDISAPADNASGFNLTTPISLTPSGTAGDTMYFRYFTETSELSGTMNQQINYYTTTNGMSGVTYDYDSISYTGKPNLDPPIVENHTLTIKYLDEEENEIAETYTAELESGKAYEIESPAIEGYTPDQATISGTIGNEDIEIVVTYTKNPAPVEPADPDPVEPVDPKPVDPTPTPDPTPEQPNQNPSTPTSTIPRVYPPSNIIGDASMLYLNPLGEFAYIPNTGVISDAASVFFNQGFAEVILSQGFVMAVLFIFAASFAIYFTLRRYLDPNTIAKKAPAMRAAKRNTANSRAKNAKVAKSKTKISKTAKAAKTQKSPARAKSARNKR